MPKLFPYLSEKQSLKDGVFYYPKRLNDGKIAEFLTDIKNILQVAPFYKPVMPRTGVPLSVKMTNAGSVGWVSDRTGYAYKELHPETQQPWAEIPSNFLDLWQELIGHSQPDCCLINLYSETSRMGLHQDNDEHDKDCAVLSVSIGASALFRYGGNSRNHPTKSVRLHDGDVLVFGGVSRMMYHGIDRVFVNEKHRSRLNITMRKVF
jgi:alkylated DNA repair protein (DNA oxidative demethylase)